MCDTMRVRLRTVASDCLTARVCVVVLVLLLLLWARSYRLGTRSALSTEGFRRDSSRSRRCYRRGARRRRYRGDDPTLHTECLTHSTATTCAATTSRDAASVETETSASTSIPRNRHRRRPTSQEAGCPNNCGRPGHLRRNCRQPAARCHKCGKNGAMARACRSGSGGDGANREHRQRQPSVAPRIPLPSPPRSTIGSSWQRPRPAPTATTKTSGSCHRSSSPNKFWCGATKMGAWIHSTVMLCTVASGRGPRRRTRPGSASTRT